MSAWPEVFGDRPDAGAADQQSIKWRPLDWIRNVERWMSSARVAETLTKDLVASIDNLGEGRTPTSINREAVRGFAQSQDYRMLWLASLVWGYGGPFRSHMVAKGWVQPDLRERVGRIADAAKRGAGDVFDAHRSGPRPFGMGVAMGSKLWHFAGIDAVDVAPQIYDENVWLALNHGQIFGKVWPESTRIDRASYVAWCTWVRDISDEVSVEPADVELAVFKHGRTLRQQRA